MVLQIRRSFETVDNRTRVPKAGVRSLFRHRWWYRGYPGAEFRMNLFPGLDGDISYRRIATRKLPISKGAPVADKFRQRWSGQPVALHLHFSRSGVERQR